MIVVTGASGFIGKAAIQFLLKKMPADHIVGMVRDVNKDKELNESLIITLALLQIWLDSRCVTSCK